VERKFKFSLGEHYHIFNRGIEKRQVFFSDDDYFRFLILLFVSNNTKRIHLSSFNIDSFKNLFLNNPKETLVDIGAYCILPNHFHLLLKEKREGGISKFMSKLMTSYAMYFNKRYGRTGPLFNRPFRAKHIDNDEYLKYIYAYIHLNVFDIFKKGWRENPKLLNQADYSKLKKYKYSSYSDYVKIDRVESKILNKQAFPDYFDNSSQLFKEFIDEWLLIKEEQTEGEPLRTPLKGSPWKDI